MIKAVFFDLDGTLLPFDESEFIKVYFGLLYNYLKDYGYDQARLYETLFGGTMLMYKNNGTRTNEEVFWDNFKSIFGEDKMRDRSLFDRFYETDFHDIKKIMKNEPFSPKIIEFCKKNQLICVLSTNPIFPKIATEVRMGATGLKPTDFDFITTMENWGYCKPNPMYFAKLLEKFNLKAEEVILFGNNEVEDAVCAETVGIKTYLIDSKYYYKTCKEERTFNVITIDKVIDTIKSHL